MLKTRQNVSWHVWLLGMAVPVSLQAVLPEMGQPAPGEPGLLRRPLPPLSILPVPLPSAEPLHKRGTGAALPPVHDAFLLVLPNSNGYNCPVPPAHAFPQ